MSSFDPDLFLNQETSESNATTFTPVPEGEFSARIEKVEAKVVGQSARPVLNILWRIFDSPEATEATGMDEPSVRQTVWLDVTASGGLDTGKGKNVQLGKLREALGQNVPGRAWNPGMLEGSVAMVKISHRAGQGDGEVFADVKSVSAL
jgi:hypothetical protein